MASSRKSAQATKTTASVIANFERALEAILARVVVSGVDAGDRHSAAHATSPSVLPIAIAYSGGLDSSVLLHLAARYCQQHGIPLHALHVHHGLSPNADTWLDHCAQQAAALKLPFDAVRVDLSDTLGSSLEHAARARRYAALGQLCRQHCVPLLLTAHHQDDQAETVLMQILRGTGVRGLSGMPDLHASPGLLGDVIQLGRPLLECPRTALQAVAAELAIAHINDESNADTRYRRNAIRQHIMPVIEQHSPGFAATLARGSQHWQSAQRLLDELAAIDLAACADGASLHIAAMAQFSDDRANNLLRYWLLAQGARYSPTTAQLVQLRKQMLCVRTDAHPVLALCGMQLQRRGGAVVALPDDNAGPPSEPLMVQWRGEAEIEIPAWQGSLVFAASQPVGLCPQRLQSSVLTLQPRAGGERLKPHPARPSRSLKNLFQEAALPAQQRPWLPLAYLNGELVFAAGLGMDVRHADAPGGIVIAWRGAGDEGGVGPSVGFPGCTM